MEPVDAGPTIQTGITVTATGSAHFYADDRPTVVPIDFSRDSFVAFGDNGDGTFTEVPGLGFDDGRFEIRHAPVGPFVVRWTPRGRLPFILNIGPEGVDVSVFRMGRSDVVFPRRSTFLAINATRMDQWRSEDVLGLVSTNAGTAVFGLTRIPGARRVPQEGDTELRNFSFDYRLTPGALISASTGDRAVLVQHSTRREGAFVCSRIYSQLELPSLTLVEGATTAVSGIFSRVPRSSERPFRATFDSPAYIAQQASMHPRARTPRSAIEVNTLPGTRFTRLRNLAPILLSCAGTSTSSATLDLDYNNPFSQYWIDYVVAEVTFGVDFTAEGAAQAATLRQGIGIVVNAASLAANPRLAPVVSPVRNIRVGGQDALQPRTGITRTPELSWEAPAIGTPDGYRVTIVQVQSVDGRTSTDTAGSLYTTTTRARIPPGILIEGLSYVFVVQAESVPGFAVSRSPATLAIPNAYAVALTETMSP